MRSVSRALALLALLAWSLVGLAQVKVTGKVVDSRDGGGLAGATAVLQGADGQPQGTSTDLDGNFQLVKIAPGKYTMKVIFMGYGTWEKALTVADKDVKLGTIRLKSEDRELQEVKAVGTLVRQEQKGDTTQFNAEAFKVNPDATTEDLIKKLPGMEVKDGQVSQGGEQVKKVLVDGKEFFGNDPMMALRNIDANMVKSIQVYDKESKQASFTGFSDGDEQKTINIMTKMGIARGRFGRIYGGVGTDFDNVFYEGGGNYNVFKGNHRFSALGMINNVNQQNFSFDDVGGAMSNGGGRAMRGTFTPGQSGRNRTAAVGLNYNFEREDTISVQTSYFFNFNRNVARSDAHQEYFTDGPTDPLRTYDSESFSKSHNYNHRFNLRVEWTINPNNQIQFAPSFSWQKYDGRGLDLGYDALDSIPYKTTSQRDRDETSAYNFQLQELEWQHKFRKDRRTLSLRVTGGLSKTDAQGRSASLTTQTDKTSQGTDGMPGLEAGQDLEGEDNDAQDDETTETSLVTSQNTGNLSKSQNIGGRLMYTEPLGQYMALQVNYRPSYKHSEGDKRVEADSTDVADDYEADRLADYRFSELLSNKKESKYVTQGAGLGLRFQKGKTVRANIGVNFQHSTLEGEQFYPLAYETKRSFNAWLPQANLQVRYEKSINLRLRYRASTDAPSIGDLQKVVDVSNVRRYSTGNDNLKESTTHQIRLFSAFNRVETSRFIFMMCMMQVTQNAIATSSVIATRDSLIDNGITLPKGVQFNKPVNLDGKVSGRVNITLSTPVKWLGSNVSLNLGANFNRTPSLYNYKKVMSRNYALNFGLRIGSSFSENIDFNLGYNGGYNIVKSSQTVSNNYNYYNHTLSLDLNLLWAGQRFVFTNNLAHNYTSGMGAEYDKNYLGWNAAFGVKVFKDHRGEIRLRVNDILNSAESSSRSIQDAYVQTSNTDVLGRYAMLTFTYKIKRLGNQPQMPGPPGGGPRPMGPPPGGPPR